MQPVVLGRKWPDLGANQEAKRGESQGLPPFSCLTHFRIPSPWSSAAHLVWVFPPELILSERPSHMPRGVLPSLVRSGHHSPQIPTPSCPRQLGTVSDLTLCLNHYPTGGLCGCSGWFVTHSFCHRIQDGALASVAASAFPLVIVALTWQITCVTVITCVMCFNSGLSGGQYSGC